MHGGVVDFTGSRDPRAHELERRIVMSQYLTAVNCAGEFPPQEEGLFSNSWNGKFHLEMHAWHAAHFAVWGRPQLLERSMPWYAAHLRASAPARQGPRRARRVVAEDGGAGRAREPEHGESVHHVAAAATQSTWPRLSTRQRLRARRSRNMASWCSRPPRCWPAGRSSIARRSASSSGRRSFRRRRIRIPADYLQSHVRAGVLALRHRDRAAMALCGLGLRKTRSGTTCCSDLSKLPEKDGLYLAAESQPDLWERSRSPECSKGKTATGMPESRSSLVRRRAWACCPAGASIARPCAAR